MTLTILPQRSAPRTARRQAGQAMAFTLAFAVAAGLIGLLLFNSGMLANAKTRLQNAADAGAYSAAVLQARDHNFAAYMNRAMVANQVAVVQIISIKSFLEDAVDTRDRMDGAILSLEELIPTSKPIWNASKSVPIKSTNSAFMSVAPTVVKGLDKLIATHEAAQEAHHMATVTDMLLVADEVVKRNDKHAAITKGAFTVGRAAIQIKNWGNSTTRHRANDESAAADRFADVTVSDKSTDVFTRFRPSVPMPMWGPTSVSLCMLAPNYVSSTTVFGFVHNGGSHLSENKKRWVALDATLGGGFQSCTFWYPCWTGICFTTETTPLIDGNFGLGGSGGGLAGKGDYDSVNGYKNSPNSSNMFGGALIVPAVPAWLRYAKGPGTSLDEAGGLQNYYRDMAKPDTSKPANQSPEKNGGGFPITFEVERKEDSVRTSSKFLPDSQRIKLDDGAQHGSLRALSASHAYFYRAKSDSGAFTHGGWQRDDGRTELANLFNPYWQSRLVDSSTGDRAASWLDH